MDESYLLDVLKKMSQINLNLMTQFIHGMKGIFSLIKDKQAVIVVVFWQYISKEHIS